MLCSLILARRDGCGGLVDVTDVGVTNLQTGISGRRWIAKGFTRRVVRKKRPFRIALNEFFGG